MRIPLLGSLQFTVEGVGFTVQIPLRIGDCDSVDMRPLKRAHSTLGSALTGYVISRACRLRLSVRRSRLAPN